ncbi:MAG: short chain dehydrogenase [Caulobacteraceae bacterium]|nr:short chain dehydrogenase [Caulobacteraceae bacterium]
MEDRGWALVTGAARRIGRTLAQCVAEAGFDVVAHSRTAADADGVAAEVRALGRRARTCGGDLADPRTPRLLLEACPAPPTLLINCASVFEPDEISTLDVVGLDTAYAVNLRAPVLLAQAFAEALPPDQRGLIVNILDQRVWRLNPLFFSYTLSKAALWTATQTLAQALAPRIRVNGVAPGPTLPSAHQTPEIFAAEAAATPLGAAVDPREIGRAVVYLIEASSVTGLMIAVDGGQHLAWQTPDVVGE